jgi:peptidoglycan/xylan/chitin deacetylase (PgdA/CDA1 family)
MSLRRSVFSALSWRVEARAAALPAHAGQRVRQRFGRVLTFLRAHDCLPDIAGRAAILCFHGVVDRHCDQDVEREMLEVRAFRKLLCVLRRSFNVISLAQLVTCIQEQQSPPPRSIVLTFDDGYANNHAVAAEELQRCRMPWSAFLPAMLIETGARQWIDDVRLLMHRGSRRRLALHWGKHELSLDLTTRRGRHEAVHGIHQLCRYVPENVRRERLRELYGFYSEDEMQSLREAFPSFAPMTWDQARELKSAGVDVGSHALTHIALAPQAPETIRCEVVTARQLLQERIGDHSPHFSYPYGREASISEHTEAELVRAGHTCGLTLEQDAIHCTSADLLRLPRIIVSPLVGKVLFGLWQRFIR